MFYLSLLCPGSDSVMPSVVTYDGRRQEDKGVRVYMYVCMYVCM